MWKIKEGKVLILLIIVVMIMPFFRMLFGAEIGNMVEHAVIIAWIVVIGVGDKEPSIIQMKMTPEEVEKLEQKITKEFKQYIDETVKDGELKSSLMAEIFDGVEDKIDSDKKMKGMIA